MEPLLLWMISFAVPAAIGAGAYLFCRRLREPNESLLNFVLLGSFILLPSVFGFLFTVNLRLGLPGAAFSIPVDSANFGFFLLLATAFAWKLGGWMHEKTAYGATDGWSSSDFLMFSAMLISLGFSPIGIGALHLLTRNGLRGVNLEVFWIPYFLSLALTPAMTPFLFWIVKNSDWDFMFCCRFSREFSPLG